MLDQLRHERVKTCAECRACDTGDLCSPARGKLRRYDGIRFTSDGFDCALPVSIDSHSHCSYGCLYCFSDTLLQHRIGADRGVGQTSLRRVEKLFSGDGDGSYALFQKALKYDRRNSHGYPCPVQLGALCDPCDNIERQQGWLLEFIKLAIKYRQPVRISTKGVLFQIKEYLDAIAQAPELFWVAFSIISPDDEILEKIDVRAPNATERLKTMKVLSGIGVKTALRFRPIFPGISDATPRYPRAYKTLIEKAAEAGAGACSYEVGFAPGVGSRDVKRRWKTLGWVAKVDLLTLYAKFGPRANCMRPSYQWTENIMHAIHEQAHENGMVCGVSDPAWKQLTDTGCCCGILPDDPVFGNWQRESATNQLLEAKLTGKLLAADDIIPEWARETKLTAMVDPGPGPKSAYKHRHVTWADKLREIWNHPLKERSPLNYFQGALMPVKRNKKGDLVYRYEGLQRQHRQFPQWAIQ